MKGQTYRKKWLGSIDTETTISLDKWVSELSPDPQADLILQMDI